MKTAKLRVDSREVSISDWNKYSNRYLVYEQTWLGREMIERLKIYIFAKHSGK